MLLYDAKPGPDVALYIEDVLTVHLAPDMGSCVAEEIGIALE
jgi:hypothetical protein